MAAASPDLSALDDATVKLTSPATFSVGESITAGTDEAFSTADAGNTCRQFTMVAVLSVDALNAASITSSASPFVQISVSGQDDVSLGLSRHDGGTYVEFMNGDSSVAWTGSLDAASSASYNIDGYIVVALQQATNLVNDGAGSRFYIMKKNSDGTYSFDFWSRGVAYPETEQSSGQYNTLTISSPNAAALDSLYLYNSSMSGDDLLSAASTALVAASIPEPTTATLSLLALAGLAARRRRK